MTKSAPRSIVVEVHPDDADEAGLTLAASRHLGVDVSRITGLRLKRKTIDARRGRVRVRAALEVGVDAPFAPEPLTTVPDLEPVVGEPAVAVVGAGPAGLFCAWGLARRGVPCVVIERGRSVRARRRDIAQLNREGRLDPDSNYCFGEGGAGTFSDGKLYTRARKRGPIADVIALLVACGAPPRIQWDARPHIGTNRLPRVIGELRGRLEAAGVPVWLETRLEDLEIKGGRLAALQLSGGRRLPIRAAVLATGHSARDVYALLARRGVCLEAKPFALGVRAEHPQPLIDRIQYGDLAGHPQLGAAPYSVKRTVGGVGVYSFCMCPGGFIVAAATGPGEVVVNGMSPFARGSRFANSGIVVTAQPPGDDPLAGSRYQAAIEAAAHTVGGGDFRAPAQRLTDFVDGRTSSTLPDCSYRRGLNPADLREVLPAAIADPLRDTLRWIDRVRLKGYLTHEAVLVGVESRTSSPVRVPRDADTLQSPGCSGLYPCGEGAGYAGGIASAALDGLRVADVIAGEER